MLENLPERQEGEVDMTSHLAGKVILEKGARIVNSHIRGPVIVGENTVIKDSYIGPFTSIYHDCTVENSEVEFSIIMDHCRIIDVGIRIESSILGSEVEILRAGGKPRNHRFILGAQSYLEIV